MNNKGRRLKSAFLLFIIIKFLGEKIINSKSYRDTIKAGRSYAKSIKPGDVIGLKGELGTGKTQFVKGVCEYFKVSETVNSPTFLIVNEYKGLEPVSERRLSIHHFDLYRLKFKEELDGIGFNEYIGKDSICIIEWCELVNENYDIDLKMVEFEYGKGINERKIRY